MDIDNVPSDERFLYEYLFAYRLSIEDTVFDEYIIIQRIKIILARDFGYRNNQQINNTIYNFYRYYNIDIPLDVISNINNCSCNNIHCNLPSNLQNNFNIHSHSNNNLHSNLQSDLSNNMQSDLSNNLQSSMQNSLQSDLSNNLQSSIQSSLNSDISNNLQSSIQSSNLQNNNIQITDLNDIFNNFLQSNNDLQNSNLQNNNLQNNNVQSSENKSEDNIESKNNNIDHNPFRSIVSSNYNIFFNNNDNIFQFRSTRRISNRYNPIRPPLFSSNNNVDILSAEIFNFLDEFINNSNSDISGNLPPMEDVVVTAGESINKLITSTLENDTEDACVICMSNMCKDESVSKLPCTHIFHDECIRNYLVNFNKECPICRKDVREI
jgi:hypothetical protein